MGSESESSQPAPRTISSSAIRKTATTTGARKANVLGAKKTQKLGAKKIADTIDFDAAEKKAKEEAERIEKLGYDPDAETATADAQTRSASTTTSTTEKTNIAAPTPLSPGKAAFGATRGHERSSSEIERLGMGMGRLGFGQIGGAKAAAAPKKMGFGSMGPSKAVDEGQSLPISPSPCPFPHFPLRHPFPTPIPPISHTNPPPHYTDDDAEKYARTKFGAQKGISSDEFFGRAAFDPAAQSEAKSRLQGFEGATSISSNAYFGRPEDEGTQEGGGGGEYGDLEGAARDFVRKFGVTAGDDLENLTQVLGEGASRLQGEWGGGVFFLCLICGFAGWW